MKSVLLVDDDPTFCELVCDLLSPLNMSVQIAYNGVEALTLLREKKVDTIVSDIQMPEMDGITFYKRVKLDETLKDIPFVFVTGLSDGDLISHITENLQTPLFHKTAILPDLIDHLNTL